jgi:hypothetical protein
MYTAQCTDTCDKQHDYDVIKKKKNYRLCFHAVVIMHCHECVQQSVQRGPIYICEDLSNYGLRSS